MELKVHYHVLSYKMTVLWDVAPCSLVVYRLFKGACCFYHHSSNDGGSKHLWNVCKLLPHYTAQHPRRQSSSYSPPWKTWNLIISILSYMNTVHSLTQYFLKVHFNIILPSMLRSPKWCPQGFPTKMYAFLASHMRATCPVRLIFLDLSC
jgi:hypothetical protein